MFDDLRQAVKNIEFLTNPNVGEVRVGAPDPIMVGVLPAVLDLRRKYPGISIIVMPTLPAQQYRQLRERKVELFFGRVTPAEEEIHAENHDRILVVAGPNSKWARRRKVELSELADEPWGLPLPDTISGSLVADAFRARGMNFPPNGAVWGAASLINALLPRGPFLGAFPASLLRFGANIPRLKVLPVNLPIPPWPVGVMTLKNRTLTPAAKRFINCAREVVRPLANKN